MSEWPRMQLLGCALAGGVIAAFAELIQKKTASAIVEVSDTVKAIFLVPFFTPAWALVLVAVVSAILCWVFLPKSRAKAFYLGASVVTLITTGVPHQELPTAPGSGVAQERVLESPLRGALGVATAFAQPARGTTSTTANLTIRLQTGDGRGAATLPTVTVTFSRRARSSDVWLPTARATVAYDPAKPGLSFPVAPGTYRVTVEAPGYEITSREITIEASRSPTLQLELRRTWVPVQVQRLYRR